jgi:hypothetical protein
LLDAVGGLMQRNIDIILRKNTDLHRKPIKTCYRLKEVCVSFAISLLENAVWQWTTIIKPSKFGDFCALAAITPWVGSMRDQTGCNVLLIT